MRNQRGIFRRRKKNELEASLAEGEKLAAMAPVPEAAVEGNSMVPQGLWCWGAYLAAFLLPVSGLTMGLLFVNGKGKAARRFAWACLILAAVGWALFSLAGKLEEMGMSGESKYLENYY